MLTMRWLLLSFALVMGAVQSQQQPQQTPRVETKQQSKQTPPAHQDAKAQAAPSQPTPIASVPSARNGKPKEHTKDGSEDGTEFWPALFGYRLKVTDTLLVIFTALVFAATVFLYLATRDLVTGAEKTAERQLRAYVTPKAIESHPVLDEIAGDILTWRVRILWQNTGQTPANHFMAIAKVDYFKPEIPPDYEFPFDAHSIPNRQEIILGPNSEIHGGACTLDPKWIRELFESRGHSGDIYLWATCTYRDVFANTPLRTIDYCVRIDLVNNPYDKDFLKSVSRPFLFTSYHRHNSSE